MRNQNNPPEDGITRRDFLNGILLAAGGAAVGAMSPMRAFAHYAPGTNWPADGSIGLDPRALSGGNVPSSFMAAHWLRDNRLTFSPGSVKVAASKVDPTKGTFPITPDTGQYDAIIVGGGLSGLSSAYHLLLTRPNAKILILEANPRVGGNGSRDESSQLPVIASAATAYFVYPFDQFLFDFYNGLGVEYNQNIITGSTRGLYFDSAMPATSRAVWNGTPGWVLDTFSHTGLTSMPFTTAVQQDFQKARQDFRNWYDRNGSPTDPPDLADPKYDYLAYKSLKDYLLFDLGVHQAVVDFYDTYASDCLAGITQYINAHASISFLGSEHFDLCAFPGGNSYLTRRALKRLIPASINGSSMNDMLNNPINYNQIDLSGNQVRYRINASGLRVDQNATSASVTYYLNGQFFKATAKAVVLAGQMHTAHWMVNHLIDATRLANMAAYQTVPSKVMNVTVKHSRFLANIGPNYDYYWYSSGVWQDAIRADYVSIQNDPAKLYDGTRRTVMTVYDGSFGDPATTRQQERVELHTQPFSYYEEALRQDMNRVFGPYDFDFNRDVESLSLNRWGHALCVPYIGWTFGPPTMSPNGQIMRTEGDRALGSKPIGRISFGAQDTEGAPATEDAIYAGLRTAQEISQYL